MSIPAEIVNRFRDVTLEHGLVLYTGAGLSRASGLPAWNGLLRQLFAAVMADETDPALAATALAELGRLPGGQLQPLVMGRLLKDQLGDGLRNAVRESFLASLVPGRAMGAPLPTLADLAPGLGGPLLEAAALLIRDVVAKRALRGVVTYNYDDLLEAKLSLLGIDCTAVVSPLRAVKPGVLPIYHVHGHIPLARETAVDREAEREVARVARLPDPARDVFRRIAFGGQTVAQVAEVYGRSVGWVDRFYQQAFAQIAKAAAAGDPEDSVGDNFVLSEDEYHREYAEPFRWSNVVQTSLLSRHAALFVGISLADPNHRRLIDLTRQAGSAAARFAILSQPALLDKDDHPLNELTRVLRRMDRLSLEKLDVHVVEAKHHDDVPGLLGDFTGALA